MSANTRFDTLSDYVKHAANVKVRCACGRVSVLDARMLSRLYLLHCWTVTKETLGGHLRCSVCGRRPVRIGPTPEPVTTRAWEPAGEREWKRLQRRLRG